MNREEEQKNLLGRGVAYPTHYSPEILVAIERESARRGYGIIGTPPFVGFDVWHAYESSFLNKSGVPISVVTKIVYPADSPYIVESKSLKLYLASFYMEHLGDSSGVNCLSGACDYVDGNCGGSRRESLCDEKDLSGAGSSSESSGSCGDLNSVERAIRAYDEIVARDLSLLLKTDVKVCSFEEAPLNKSTIPYASPQEEHRPLQESELPMRSRVVELDDFAGYERLESIVGIENIEIGNYSENPALLEERQTLLEKSPALLNEKQALMEKQAIRCYTNLLKSNCKVTGQPDHGTLYIAMKGNIPSKLSLLKYIISLRGEKHFHEEICEMVYQRLYERFHPERLTVTALYTRRGGIDICPVRSSSLATIPSTLTEVTLFDSPTFRR